MERLLIAQDIGGSKAESLLFSDSGEILRRTVLRGVNALDKGLEAARACCLDGAKEIAGKEDISSIYCGMAGGHYYGASLTAALKEAFPSAAVTATSDMPMLITAMLGHRDGAGLICGTGTSLCIRRGNEISQVGGYGYTIDNRGGGFDLGRQAVYAALREKDGRGEHTLLTVLLEERLGDKIEQAIPKLYEGGIPCFASFAPIVFEARRAGDRAAGEILDQGADHLAEMTVAACGRLGKPFTLVLNGGIFTHFPEYADALTARIPESVTVVRSNVPPILGAAMEAMHQQGLPDGEPFRDAFLSSYQKYT